MKTKEELIEDLKKSKKNYSDEQIAEIVEKYEIRLNNPRLINSRAKDYKRVADLLEVKSLNDVRFYKIMNVSAVVVRDSVNNKTKVAFAFYNLNDLKRDCIDADKAKSESGKIIWRDNNIPVLHQITISRATKSCLSAALNYHENKYVVEFNDLRISELAIYEAWIKLCKSKVIPRIYLNFNLNCHIVSETELRRRESLMESCNCH